MPAEDTVHRWASPQRSYGHYYEDIFVVIQVEQLLYRLPVALLKKRSRVFSDLFSLPRSGSICSTEGLSDGELIILHGYSSREFNCLLDYLFGRSPNDTQAGSKSQCSVPFLISLLKMSSVFKISDGKSYAIAEMETHPELDLATKLQLCFQYNLVQWLTPAFQQLISLPIEELREEDVLKIPSKILHSFIQVKHQMTTHRLTLASIPPPAMAGFACHTPLTCADTWERAWKEGPAEMLRHPDTFYSGREILDQLESVEISDVCDSCRDFSVINVKESGSLLLEEHFIENKITELASWLAVL
ncbi:hypothetical protein BV22DRAFT_1134035 [Leucogyrophana mollusca]|uniref:Uncharacterized protein n=1 Tax=Leucogyrophana mollusca TaxID=85980 RepID=A0ACB8B0H3_9AGAM|nr:hypothetical protein BV22DRAFT_1134035 [Leucogyrophana mollusca]